MDKSIENKTNMYIFLTLEYPNERVMGIHKIEDLEDVIKVTYDYVWEHTIIGWVEESTTLYVNKDVYSSFLKNTLMEGIVYV